MSRVGRKPIPIPQGVEVSLQGNQVRVRGPKGELSRSFDPRISVAVQDGRLVVSRQGDDRAQRALHGLSRALLANMVAGVSQGFRKELEIEGVGYRAEVRGKRLVLLVGYSHPVEIDPPPGVALSADKGGKSILVEGIDKEVVGEVAAKIRSIRPPEPYKGKGIRYVGEHIRRKAGKAGKAVGTGG